MGLHHLLIEALKLSKNVQVSCPLPELCGGRVVGSSDNLLMMFRRASPSDFFSISRHLLIAHASSLSLLVPLWQMRLALLAVPVSFVLVQLEKVSEEARVQRSPSSVT